MIYGWLHAVLADKHNIGILDHSREDNWQLGLNRQLRFEVTREKMTFIKTSNGTNYT